MKFGLAECFPWASTPEEVDYEGDVNRLNSVDLVCNARGEQTKLLSRFLFHQSIGISSSKFQFGRFFW
jgi:hypothetical protein